MQERRGTTGQVPGQVREGRQEPAGVWFGERRSHGWPVGEGDGLIVAAEGDVDDMAEDASLGSEQPVDGGDRGIGGRGDRFDRGGAISAFNEHPPPPPPTPPPPPPAPR